MGKFLKVNIAFGMEARGFLEGRVASSVSRVARGPEPKRRGGQVCAVTDHDGPSRSCVFMP